jgi:hypothetical protein
MAIVIWNSMVIDVRPVSEFENAPLMETHSAEELPKRQKFSQQ